MDSIRLIPTLILVCCWAFAAEAQVAGTLPAPVAHAAKSLGLSESGISVWVQRIDSPNPLVSFNADALRNPASTMKLVTSFAALDRLGPAHTWRTEVYLAAPPQHGRVAGDVWLRGLGDPYLVAEEYWKMADAMRKLGLQRIDGDLVFDTSYFDLIPEDPGAFDSQPNRVYNLPPHPLLVNFNAVRFLVRPEPGDGSVAVSADPPLRNLQMSNRLRLQQAPCGGYQRGVALAVGDPAARDQVLLEGQFPTGCSEYALTRTVLQPESYAFGLFDLYWHQLGGEMSGRWRIGPVPSAQLEPFYVHRSRPLGDVIRMVNKYSNNVMTRHLELTLGAEMYGAPATAEKGLRAIHEVLERRGVDTTGLVVSNSAGLSRDSRISARQLAAVLRAGWLSPYMPEFMSSLAISGLDGTMRRRLPGTSAVGRMHLKTGSLNDVSAVAGYALQESGARWLVVVLVNAPDAHRGLGEELQDAVLRWVMTIPGV
ncbi:MAG: D-alanyl-D-alanine carboxypeptidase/D-alanyl-D-alanine-endopeptidase [Pseudomonadales bacterium]